MIPNRHMDIKRVVDKGNSTWRRDTQVEQSKSFRTLEIIAVTLAVVLMGAFFYFHPSAPVGGLPGGVDIKISSPTTYTEPMTLTSSGKTFSISALGANPAQAVTVGAVTKYIDAFTNTDVTETKQSDRIKEDIILKKPGHPATFAYQIDVAPYDVVKDGQGSLVFYQKGHSGDSNFWRFEIPAPSMTDASGKKSTVSDVESALTTDGTLTVRPSAAWLAQAKYPVDLDPTIIFFRAGTKATPTVPTIFRTTQTVLTPAVGQQAYTTAGTYSWTAPTGVTSVSVVSVGGGGGVNASRYGGAGGGLGYKNNISVVPGVPYTVVVGAGGVLVAGQDSYFISLTTVKGGGGGIAEISTGGTYIGDGGGNGGGVPYTIGGGAGGYTGAGGAGAVGNGGGNGVAGTGGGGGGGGNGVNGGFWGNGAGGGVGILGQGTSGSAGIGSVDYGATSGGGGSGGTAGTGHGGAGGTYGGGGGGGGATGATYTFAGGGGGVGLYGQGVSGTGGVGSPSGIGPKAGGGSGGTNGNYNGGAYGGGGGGAAAAASGGASGAVRIIWPGTTRQFPSTGTADQ